MKKKISVGTRGSELALTQTIILINEIKKFKPDFDFEIVKIKTQGDKILDKPLNNAGGKGLFVKEIEDKLIEGKIDIAVHSMKDMPFDVPEGLSLKAVLKREDPRDAFISSKGVRFEELRKGAKIGTSSLRRKAQLIDLRPDIEIVEIRGNVGTRLKKMKNENLDGIILAAAGLKRLGMENLITDYFDVDTMVPAACQGILAVETTKVFEEEFKEIYPILLDINTLFEASAERKVMKRFGGNCKIPIGVHAQYTKDAKKDIVNIRIAYKYGDKLFKCKGIGTIDDIDKIAEKLYKSCGGK
ncbi:hydroxymethylbilane synthase [Thermoanaerobacterium sp. RBIITD]|uniref:hydroxymethylbilane synthase n=1 Tax=Thermoanaerobacterium sp. RBIITD TaxID=1550240 RepID=UPI000BB97294|nr:hydroxymethylbilane synthase [Thermoanaerobacterium sp. RBIITD]SNX55194.1 hydroxymethylbilane synthase [Thermoanaerobacterium sp. RBIITD]